MWPSPLVFLLIMTVWGTILHSYSASRPGYDNPKVLVLNDFSSDAVPKVISLDLVAKNRSEAEEECASYKNGSLAVIESTDDLQDMFWLYLTHEIYIHYADNDSYVAVGYRRQQDRRVVDATGAQLQLTNYTYWADGELNASGDCVALYRDEGLSLVPCEMNTAFFCQYNL